MDCGKWRPEELLASAPKLVIEVLSPSTRQIDQMVKLDGCRAVGSMRNVLIVDPAVLQAAPWSRGESGWTVQLFEQMEDRVVLDDPAATLTMAELYEDAPLPPRLVI